MVGVFVFHRKVTTFSEPAVLRLWPGRVQIENRDGVVLDLPAKMLGVRLVRASGVSELRLLLLLLPEGTRYRGRDKIFVMSHGTPSAQPFPPSVVQRLLLEMERAAQDPRTGALALARHPWIVRVRGEVDHSALETGSTENLGSILKDGRDQFRMGKEIHRALLLADAIAVQGKQSSRQ